MFRKETLLVLGAGASKPYGFPLGYELINDIIDCIEQDTVFFPWTPSNRKTRRLNVDRSLHDYMIFHKDSVLKKIRRSIKNKEIEQFAKPTGSYMDYSDKHIDNAIYGNFCDEDLIRVRLIDIAELKKLAEMLKDFDPVSIDAFLRDHPELKVPGQTMIIYCLLKYHNSDRFKKMSQDLNADESTICKLEKKNSFQDNWYRYLLNDIKSGCKSSFDLVHNRLSIVTFNYDVSLDFYLRDRLMRTSSFSDYAEEYLKNKLKIEHVYGSICDFEEIEEFFDLHQEDNLSEVAMDVVNFHHLLYGYKESAKIAPRIKLIGERVCDEAITSKIRSSDVIIFIGFGFDLDNLKMLGFPDQKRNYSDFLFVKEVGGVLSQKKICYLDYLGRMQSLNNEFLELVSFLESSTHGKARLVVQCSKAVSVTDAYVNDFRECLFM